MSKTPKADAAKRATKGSVQEAIGKLIGDGKVEAEGAAQQKPSKPASKRAPNSGPRD